MNRDVHEQQSVKGDIDVSVSPHGARTPIGCHSDYMQAVGLLKRLRDDTSLYGQGTAKNSDFALRVAAILDDDRPSASVVAIAGWLAVNQVNDDPSVWAPNIIGALDDAFHIRLNGDLITTQKELAESNDRLGRRMLFAARVGVAVAIVGVFVATVQLMKG